MSTLRDVIWWLCFLAAAVGIQAFVPGLDVMTVGLIILLQERDYKNMLWLLPLFILLQEGMGTRVFGGVIVWYIAVIVLFRMGRWLFEAENFLFIFLLSACLGAAYFGVAWLMAPLQDLPFNFQDTLDKSLIQAIFIPFAWKLLVATRHGKAHAAEN
ncbi:MULTISPECIES: hypothetical protein [Desulfovibrio]|uniref:Uncharacterized protein n=2 Tax=Desulfovibrio desulfuricans TaxID=876 RepID=A0AA94HUR3_DESDE|nr:MULTISPECIES: hypothetical protein [Desulfovibrio]ATD80143.1 hypothetical protein CNY67_00915 [Desulfovibrio sp. G11]MDY0204557.1 hypothetical protein [Desulfovibrio desulfuricans]SFW69071.1 hypothetical protein SAMN02910291_02534 [Desulfovibrio desulfuricans]SPD35598.1 Hypothetical protein DSVG11_1501 [Desulfovibrio sp. G11]